LAERLTLYYLSFFPGISAVEREVFLPHWFSPVFLVQPVVLGRGPSQSFAPFLLLHLSRNDGAVLRKDFSLFFLTQFGPIHLLVTRMPYFPDHWMQHPLLSIVIAKPTQDDYLQGKLVSSGLVSFELTLGLGCRRIFSLSATVAILLSLLVSCSARVLLLYMK